MSVAANEERGAGRVKITVDGELATLTPLSAVVSVGSPACAESAKMSVATTSAVVIGAPLDHSRLGRSTIV